MVDASEAFADGILGSDALRAVHRVTVEVHTGLERARDNPTASGVIEAARGLGPELNRGYVASGTLLAAGSRATVSGWAAEAELAAQAVLVRDIFGNPFRPVAFSPEWRTDTAVALARQMYESREFSAMPILADALQDAGCDSDDILNHCRGDGPHVRGCWVVDLVLEKS
jgi:hypothetical protein